MKKKYIVSMMLMIEPPKHKLKTPPTAAAIRKIKIETFIIFLILNFHFTEKIDPI